MSVEKAADGTGYWVRWRDSAGRQRKKKITLWRDAVNLDGEMKRKKAMGELIVHEKGKIKLEDFWEVWWQNYALHQLTQRTQDVYGRLWSTHVLPALGGRTTVKDVSPETVSAAVSKWSGSLATSSVWKVLAVLHGVLQRAVEWGYIPSNPATGIKKPRLTTRRGRALTTRQLDALCAELDLRSRAFALVLVWTGMRPGELRTRRWEHVSPGLIYVEATKTNSTRSVDLLPSARKALLEWFLACGKPSAQATIFPSVDGRGPWTDNAYRLWQRKVFTPAAERAGLKGLVPYDLRHTAASRLIAEGKDVLYVARQLGHSPEITLKTYAHEFEQQRKSVPSECPSEVDIARILRADGGI